MRYARLRSFWRRVGLDCLRAGGRFADRHLTGLLRLRQFAHEIDMQQAVFEARALYVDMIGKLEAALKSARGNALIKDFLLRRIAFDPSFLGTTENHAVLAALDRKLAFAEA